VKLPNLAFGSSNLRSDFENQVVGDSIKVCGQGAERREHAIANERKNMYILAVELYLAVELLETSSHLHQYITYVPRAAN
jgi:hypothetical protein